MNINKPNTQQGPLSRETVMVAVNAMRRLRALDSQAIVTKESDMEKQTARALLTNVLVNNPDELLGTWLTMNAEYTPLVQGVAALLRRAVGLNEQEAQMRNAAMKAHAEKSKTALAQRDEALTEAQSEAAAVAVTAGEQKEEELPAGKRIVVNFGEANKPAGPVE